MKKPAYDAKALFLQGLMAFGHFFGGAKADAPSKSFKTPLKNPAGSKLLRKWYKKKTGVKGDYETALTHYTRRRA